MKRSLLAVALTALVVLAGCAGSVPNGIDDGSDGGSAAGAVGHMNFYVSDEQNAIGDFEHLNVTITTVGFHKAGGADDDDDGDGVETAGESEDESADDSNLNLSYEGNLTANETINVTVVNDTSGEPVENVTITVNGDPVGETDANGELVVELPDEEEIELEIQSESEADEAEAEASDDDGDDGSAGWVERDVDNKTVDLTKLQGTNAELLAQFELPTGDYTGAMVYISGVNGTLTSGEHVNVKLPSEKLHINTQFSVGDGEEMDFVFDITVREAGNSGKYVLQPVVTESGKNIEKTVVGEDSESDEESDDGEAYNVTVDGNVSAGENVTVTVTNESGDPVENATVWVNGDEAGQTDADGQLEVTVPDEDEFEVEVEDEAGEGSFEAELGDGDDAEADAGAESEDADDESSAAFSIELTTNVTAGEDVTIAVTDADGKAVKNAPVFVDDEEVGTTGTNGELTFTAPEEDFEISVERGAQEGSLDVEVESAD